MAEVAERIRSADQYLDSRTGCYEWRCERYDAAITFLYDAGLTDEHTVVDVGAGWTEFDHRLRASHPTIPNGYHDGWRGRYIPVDACIDGTDLDRWNPPREAEFFVALEVVEHLIQPWRLLCALKRHATKGVVISTPNPETTNVLGMDSTHRTAVPAYSLEAFGFHVETRSFYGKPDDSLFAWWTPGGSGG